MIIGSSRGFRRVFRPAAVAVQAVLIGSIASYAAPQLAAVSRVQPSSSRATPAPAPVADPITSAPHAAPPGDTGFTPTWETQKHARTFSLAIPAPRGQIVDRNGEPLAQTRVSYNLSISFPTPLNFSEAAVLRFAQEEVLKARAITGRPISLTREQVMKHYRNRGILPMVIAQDLKPGEIEAFNAEKPPHLVLSPVYQRFYPNGSLAGHVLGYAGRAGRAADGPIENNELLWPNAEGREGLEQTFDAQLQGKMGQYNISFDPTGAKASEQISVPPQPGSNVVTTLDVNIQRMCEQALEKGCKRGAMVVIDPNNGDILAMASWPVFNPNSFVPAISVEAFKELQDDPDIPLLPRAFRSAYPPGSTYKVFVGLAALQTHKIEIDDEFSCPPSMEIGNLTFRNWKKTGSGQLNFAQALTQSCDTWFYQVGIKIGALPIIDYSLQVGLGQKTGIPLNAEAEGLIPNDTYMLKTHQRKMGGGDMANLSIGQGDVLVTPLQLAAAMGVVGNGGTVYQTRLVQHVQSVGDQVLTAYDVRAKSQVDIDKDVMATIRKAMVQAVSGQSGTGGKASVSNVDVAGKTGTAQWGPKNKERTAAWFAGFAPAKEPRYAFAVVYEGDVGASVHGGSSAAPLVGKVLREIFKNEKPETKKSKKEAEDADDEDDSGDEPAPSRRSRNRSYDEEAAPPPRQQAPPAPRKQSGPFWKRWFQ